MLVFHLNLSKFLFSLKPHKFLDMLIRTFLRISFRKSRIKKTRRDKVDDNVHFIRFFLKGVQNAKLPLISVVKQKSCTG
jgi:hypothetical protein